MRNCFKKKKKWEEHILYGKEKWGIASKKEEHILNGKENGANISQIVPFLPFISFFIGLSTSQDTGQMFKFTFLTFSNWVLFCFKHRCKKLPNSKHIKKSIFMLLLISYSEDSGFLQFTGHLKQSYPTARS